MRDAIYRLSLPKTVVSSTLLPLHLFQIENGLDGATECPAFLLLFVFVLDFGEVKRDLIGRVNAAAAASGLSLQESFLIGDRWRDIEAGRRLP